METAGAACSAGRIQKRLNPVRTGSLDLESSNTRRGSFDSCSGLGSGGEGDGSGGGNGADSASEDSSGSVEQLEELTTCAIHLGQLSQPRLLPCSHVFCLACLARWESQQQQKKQQQQVPASHGSLACPLCRVSVRLPPDGVRALPTAAAHQSIADYIAERHCRRLQLSLGGDSPVCARSSTRRRSLERKQEILAHLAKDFVRRSELERDAFDRAELLAVRENLNKLISRLDAEDGATRGKLGNPAQPNRRGRDARQPLLPPPPPPPSDTAQQHQQPPSLPSRYPRDDATSDESSEEAEEEDALDLSFIRHNMRRHSSYKLKEIETGFLDLQHPGAGLEIGAAGLIADPEDQVDMILLNSCSHSLLLYSSQDGRLKDFPVVLGGHRMRCYYMTFSNGLVYVSGVVPSDSATRWTSAIACVQLDGLVIRRLERPGAAAGSDEPLFAGFHVDERRGELVVAQPADQKVEFLTPALARTGHWFTFENLHPHHVTWTRERRMLWVSCPSEGHILIVNDRTGVYRKLTTTQIFDSVPAHIITTSDKRIIFTDNQRQRVFWIIRRSEFIFVQRLEFLQELADITGIAPLGEDKILVCTKRKLYFLKPTRKLRRRRRPRCDLM
ncbi:hypothetical protein BOX15_Mlig004309g3 [Macrostomum lignano]|uniref:RING-type domain-containing protein n=1 Tax=Macrostomum lignano TaxID=282301 RepID=A0A267FRC4_9PLAT|nr:hypothetical protein BOX15_Mlig004309g3 [Macrostomum lignano]